MDLFKNHEGYAEYDIDRSRWQNRRPGLSAMLRLAREEEFIRPCVESILPWFDEIVCTLQSSDDGTEEILRSFDSPKISIYRYPFESWPGGPGYSEQIRNSVHHNAYFYNWSLALTTRQWVCKWDGDMVAHDFLGDFIRDVIRADGHDMISLVGVNIVKDLKHTSRDQPLIAESQPRFFKVRPGIHYITGRNTQQLNGVYGNPKLLRMDRPGYLHFKWAKEFDASHVSWPENWRQMPELVKVNDRVHPGNPYTGKIPGPLEGVMT